MKSPITMLDARIIYGLVGDGNADDTAAVQRILDDGWKLPPGHYKINSLSILTAHERGKS